MSGSVTGQWHAGAGLVEVAVALLVLSVAALGLARVHLAARQASAEAIQRVEAVRLASGLVELLQGSRGDVAAYRFGELAEIGLPPEDCSKRTCGNNQWVAWNLWQWRGELEGTAARDRHGRAVAGLLAPAACLGTDRDMAVLQLAWRNTPAGGTPACGDPESARSGPSLFLTAHPQGDPL